MNTTNQSRQENSCPRELYQSAEKSAKSTQETIPVKCLKFPKYLQREKVVQNYDELFEEFVTECKFEIKKLRNFGAMADLHWSADDFTLSFCAASNMQKGGEV